MITDWCHSPDHGSGASFHVAPAFVQTIFVQVPRTDTQLFALGAETSEHDPQVASVNFNVSAQLPNAAHSAGDWAVFTEQDPAIPGPYNMHSPPFATSWYA